MNLEDPQSSACTSPVVCDRLLCHKATEDRHMYIQITSSADMMWIHCLEKLCGVNSHGHVFVNLQMLPLRKPHQATLAQDPWLWRHRPSLHASARLQSAKIIVRNRFSAFLWLTPLNLRISCFTFSTSCKLYMSNKWTSVRWCNGDRRICEGDEMRWPKFCSCNAAKSRVDNVRLKKWNVTFFRDGACSGNWFVKPHAVDQVWT